MLFNERIFVARYVKKQHVSNVVGVFSWGFGYLGTADQNQIVIHQRLIKRETYQSKKPLPKVELIKCALDQMESLFCSKYSNLIIDPSITSKPLSFFAGK